MQALRKISMAAVRMQLAYKPLARFSGDNWKDRDEAAEKVYISQAESTLSLPRGNHQKIAKEGGGRGRRSRVQP